MNRDCNKCKSRYWWSLVCVYYVMIGFIIMAFSFVTFIFTADVLSYMVAGLSTPPNYWCVLAILIGVFQLLAMTQLKSEHEIKCNHRGQTNGH